MGENIRLSIRGILSHKMRSILTMLGIIIGIAAIIAIVSTIKGTNAVSYTHLSDTGEGLLYSIVSYSSTVILTLKTVF